MEAKRKFGKFGEYGIFILLVFFSLTLFFYFFRNRNKGTYRCNSRHGCPTCPYIENGRRFCKFESTGEMWNIEKCITCKSTNLIYLLECKKCKKQYIGETKRSLCERFGEHRRAINNPRNSKAKTAVPMHFNLPGHSIADLRLILLKIQNSEKTLSRKL